MTKIRPKVWVCSGGALLLLVFGVSLFVYSRTHQPAAEKEAQPAQQSENGPTKAEEKPFDGKDIWSKAVAAILEHHPSLNGEANAKARAEWEKTWKDKHAGDEQLATPETADKALEELAASVDETVYRVPPSKAQAVDHNRPAAGIGAVVEVNKAADQLKDAKSPKGEVLIDATHQLVVKEVIDDSPAAKAGILAGDCFAKVDGKEITGLTLPAAVDKIKGAEGTDVDLVMVRAFEPGTKSFKIKRAKVLPPAVSYSVTDGIARISCKTFDAQVKEQFIKRLGDAAKERGLVVDLRDNGGGTLQDIIAVVSAMLPEGMIQTVTNSSGGYQEGVIGDRLLFMRNGKDLAVQSPRTPLTYPADKPLVILVNKGTSCGAEMLTKTLQGRRATVVGEKTPGLAVVHIQVKLPSDRMLIVRNGEMLPNGRKLLGVGVTPDLPEGTPRDLSTGDVQLEVARGTVRAMLPAAGNKGSK